MLIIGLVMAGEAQPLSLKPFTDQGGGGLTTHQLP